jgi:hypothetical protein
MADTLYDIGSLDFLMRKKLKLIETNSLINRKS